jgi:FAD/FMN-containing dehydrogenase
MVDLQATTTTGTYSALPEAAMAEFRASLGGNLFLPSDAGYDKARKVWNANVDKHPALIAHCAGVADVINSVNFARDNNLLVSVRGGGHNYPGICIAEGGLVIDLSQMTGVRVDPARRTARAEGGAKWAKFDRETQAFGLATTGGTNSDTGIAGLTLGGGHGWLGSKYGLACDNLLSADVVTADGRFLTASADENSDLFWGIQGGGGNFGVVTSFEFRLHPVGPVLAGLVLYPFEQAREAMQFYRDFSSHIPDELTTANAFLTSPEGAKMVAIAVCYNGPAEEGEKVIRPLRKFGPPVADLIGPMPYTGLQSMLDPSAPPGNQHYGKAHFMREISDPVIDILIDHYSRVASPRSIHFLQQTSGAMQRGDTAYSHRDARYNLILMAQWLDSRESEIHVRWTRDLWEALQPYATGGVYVNDIGGEADGDGHLFRAAYGPNYPRLVEIKNKYDPTNFFRHNQNIKPTI